MKGNNTLSLNDATLIEALQEYFDKRIKPHIEVTGVDKVQGIFKVNVVDDTRMPPPGGSPA